MSNHTPGPWTWTIDDKSMATLHGLDYFYNHVMSVSPCLSCVESMDDNESPLGKCTMPNVENARLIAAAPELLAALKLARDVTYNGFEPENQSDAHKRICAAIAKAEGA